MLGVLGIFKAKGTAVFNDVASRPSEIVGGSFTSLLPIKCALNSQIYGPFILNMSAPPAALIAAAVLMIPKYLLERKIRRARADAIAPVFKGKFNLPRMLAVHTLLRAPMTATDVTEWFGTFRPLERIAGVFTFLLFFLYVVAISSSNSVLPSLTHTPCVCTPPATPPSSSRLHRSSTAQISSRGNITSLLTSP